MKPRYLLPALLLVAASAPAAVYKWVDADGKTHYADHPSGEVPAQTITLPKPPPLPAPPPTPAAGSQQAGKGTDKPFTGYTRIAIVEPSANATVRSNQRRVTVVVELDPALRPGHRLAVLLDGRQLGDPINTTRIVLQDVHRGRHWLQVRVVDATGKSLGESTTVYFTLRQAALEPDTTPPPDDYTPAPNQSESYKPPPPPSYKPESPSSYKPDPDQPATYTPPKEAPPYKPGTTAPGYAPKYTP